MKKLFFAFIAVILWGQLGHSLSEPNMSKMSSAQFKPTGTDVPFPYGSEIPFPWYSFEGDWYASDGTGWKNYFGFYVLSENQYGTRIFEVRHYDCNANLIGEGTGIAPEGDKVIRAAMKLNPVASCYNPDTDASNRYWVIVRAYERITGAKKTKKTYTYLTLLPFNYSDWTKGEHYRIKKLKGN